MNFSNSKGVIALDIDGTLTANTHTIHSDVIDFLNSLAKQGWKFIFITGRPFPWGHAVLQYLPFPYVFVVQNGALILEMPHQAILDRKVLDFPLLASLEPIWLNQKTDAVIYSGWENQDICYFRPERLTPEIRDYLSQRCSALGEVWEAVEDFHHLPIDDFSSLKCFTKDQAQAFLLSSQMEEKGGVHAPVIRDPFNSDYFVIQATHREATKGEALKHYKEKYAASFVIAAGDDFNDVSMLQEANVKIVMANAPKEVLAVADVIAPPASENGIIVGLMDALSTHWGSDNE